MFTGIASFSFPWPFISNRVSLIFLLANVTHRTNPTSSAGYHYCLLMYFRCDARLYLPAFLKATLLSPSLPKIPCRLWDAD
ncbi:hypothetical protein Agabi119p4_7345 [Agaricus bisporus var. burnettii]|uniref:Uncharacterized protein n=1 Tax=Agaricus bisporus var. burnettii TaxID=192524 RepID=A0A8H7C6W8_AGABI|nr:hypothetical protein Agabi119p4_7345 [Agaricus bisporus var. burnettii]